MKLRVYSRLSTVFDHEDPVLLRSLELQHYRPHSPKGSIQFLPIACFQTFPAYVTCSGHWSLQAEEFTGLAFV
jgi:hypothetical protein